MSRIEFCHDSPRFSIAHRCVGGYSHMSQMCMCASCLKPYLDARLFFLAIKKTLLSHDGGYFHNRLLLFSFFVGFLSVIESELEWPLCLKAGLLFVLFFSVGSVRVNIYSEYLTDTHWDEWALLFTGLRECSISHSFFNFPQSPPAT